MPWLYIIGAGNGIVMNKDVNQLTDMHGEMKLTNDWARFVKQKACSQSIIIT